MRKDKDVDPLTLEMLYYFIRKAMKWISKHIGMDYPFKKLDVLFVPEMKQIARENAGCIVIDDKFLSAINSTQEKKFKHYLVFEL
jgi:aminopeptidase N